MIVMMMVVLLPVKQQPGEVIKKWKKSMSHMSLMDSFMTCLTQSHLWVSIDHNNNNNGNL